MANDIYFGATQLDDLKFGSSQVDKVYLGDVLVWPISTSGGIISTTIDEGGVAAGDHSGTYNNVPQLSSDGSGTGAEFNITVTYVSNKNRSVMTSQAVDISNQGSGYASGEIVTLDMSGTSGTWGTPPDIEVLTVTT